MIIGFIVWSAVSAVMLGIGIRAWFSEKAAGFYSGVEPPEVTDVRKYNRAVAVLWFVYATMLELLGIPFLFLKQNSPLFILSIAGTVALSFALMFAYHRILMKYRRK